jgi:type II secretory pathway pseudopilin PulG
MIDELKEETAALHALDLLEGAERERFVAELRGDPGLRGLVAGLRRASAALAHAAPESEPPAALRARVLESVSLRSATGAPAVGRAAAPLPAWVPWLAAACIGVAVWSASRYVSAEREISSLREQGRVAQAALEQARSELERARVRLSESGRAVAELSERVRSESDLANLKVATLVSMLGNSPEALAVAVWDPAREEGVLKVSKLPPSRRRRTTSSGSSTPTPPRP